MGALTAVSVVPESYQVNQINPYTIKFTIANALTTGSVINIVFPSDLPIETATATCTMAGHTCTISSSTNASITVNSAITASTQLTVVVNDVHNAIEAKTTASFAIYTYYDSGYDSLVNQITSGLTITTIAKVLASGTATPTSKTTYELTSYTVEIPLDDPIPVGGSILVIFPATTSP